MKSHSIYCIVHITVDGRKLYHLGSGCRLGRNRLHAEHFVTDDPLGQTKRVQDHLEFALRSKCSDLTPEHERIDFTTFEIIPRREITRDDKLICQRMGLAA